MFTQKAMRNTIKKYMDNGIRQYIIYPFGANGVAVKNCMEDCFGISPIMIVDNEYYHYNTNIISINELKQCYCKDMYIILTAENSIQNLELEKELQEFVPKDRIINDLISEKISEEGENLRLMRLQRVGDRFSLKKIIPQDKTYLRGYHVDGKIKVRIAHDSYYTWNCVKTICEEFEKDARFDVMVILIGEMTTPNVVEIYKKQMEEGGHRYIFNSDYCAEEDKADILIVYCPFSYQYIKGGREHTKLIIAVSNALIQYSYSIELYWRTRNFGLEIYRPDYYLFDSLLFNELKESPFYSDRIVEMGNAKFDGIYNACLQKKYPDNWEKLQGKRVILWATDHGVYNGRITDNITFDLYAQPIFQYAKEHPDMGLIVRPHSAFIRELLVNGYWSGEDLTRIKEYCKDTLNVVWDDTDSYDIAYSVADAILTDAFCGITISALPTLKPICIMYRNDMEVIPYHKEIVENYYSAHNEKELIEFFDMIRDGKDPMLEQRKEISQKYVKHFDGRNGERIKNFIVQAYDAAEQRLL